MAYREEHGKAHGEGGGGASLQPLLAACALARARRAAVTAEAVLHGNAVRRASADFRLPCMLYAAVGAISNEPEDSHVQTGTDARGVPGVIQVIRLEREIGDGFAVGASTLAVVARGYWLARQSLARMMPSGVHPGSAPTDSAAIVATHATAQFVEGRLRIWVANVDINPIRERAAHTSGLPEDHIDVRTVGHREGDCSAAVLAMAIWLARRLESAPVQAIVASDRALHLVPSAGPGTGVPMAA